jgi:protein ImuB
MTNDPISPALSERSKSNGPTTVSMPFACIFVPDFPAEAILRAEPELRSQAVAVLEDKPPLQTILAINEKARRAGVLPGMTKLQVEGCTKIALRERSALQESAAHQALFDCAQSFSPRVEDVAPDTLLLDLSGLGALFGSLPTIAREIYHRASMMGLEINVAAAFTLEAAQLAARGFSGVTVVPEGKESEVLGGLPVAVLFADEIEAEDAEEFLQTFHRWGIRKFRDLIALPAASLSERLGQRGLELQRKAAGIGARTLFPSDPPLQFEEVMELEFPLVLLEPLAFLLNRMLDQLCARLQARALAAQELSLELTLENGRSENNAASCFRRAIHLPVPLVDANVFLKLLQLDLKAHPPGAPVVKIRLRIEPTKPRSAQNGLFLPASPEPEKLELTLARIAGVVGEGRAGSPQLLDTHRPQAFEMRRFTPSAPNNGYCQVPKNKNKGLKTENLENKDLVTALRIFRPRIAVVVTYQDGRPSHISSERQNQITGEVLWAAGPWRSSGDWWEQDSWVRDEWDIAVQEKSGIALYRLVHDLVGGRWVLEGSYD